MARKKGVQIVHAPSDCMEYYRGHPGREIAKTFKDKSVGKKPGEGKLECGANEDWFFEISHGGCDDYPKCTSENKGVWTKQIAAIEIVERNIITYSGTEAGSMAIDTSLGHWDDWENIGFKIIMFNSVDYLLNLKNK